MQEGMQEDMQEEIIFPTSVQSIQGLFNTEASPAAPVFGNGSTLEDLQATVNAGWSISNDARPDDNDSGRHAFVTTIRRLQHEGLLPPNILGLIDQNGGPDHAKYWSERPGNPPFKNFDIAYATTLLKLACAHSLHAVKPVVQLGILTTVRRGDATKLEAETFHSHGPFSFDQDVATHTAWIFRWCMMGEDGTYTEHWRPFAPRTAQVVTPPLEAVDDQGLNVREDTPMADMNVNNTSHTPASTNPAITPSPTTTASPNPPGAPAPNRRRNNYFVYHDHTPLTDAELFSGDPGLVQGDAMLRLAWTYTNKEILDSINANRPELVISGGNVITKRITLALTRVAEDRVAAEIAAGEIVADLKMRVDEIVLQMREERAIAQSLSRGG